MKDQIINNSISTVNFSQSYPLLNKYMVENATREESRNGDTKEILNFKTELLNPYKRCVGNNERNINVFFLLAEALWIFRGRKDLKFLEIFNSQMKEYSDDGVSFHAPYGFRLRHYGVSSFETISNIGENQNHAANQQLEGLDQIFDALSILEEDPQSRQAVLSIWNPELDLRKKTKDIPCNDMVMLKIRAGKLHTTIANRSNDLHWGLPTNIFQFSFTTEIMSLILGVELGTQVHNSQSLHFYLSNDIAMKMYENLQLSSNLEFTDLYDISSPMKMDLDFDFKEPSEVKQSIYTKLRKVDFYIDLIIESILNDKRLEHPQSGDLMLFSSYFYMIYELLWIYKDYKAEPVKNDDVRLGYIDRIKAQFGNYETVDVITLALNFFYARLSENSSSVNGKL